MFYRSLQLPPDGSFFLFGARNTGKTHLIRQRLSGPDVLYLDLLDPELVEELSLKPGRLTERVRAASIPPKWVVIDEVQRVPRLLDVVHHLIETTPMQFALTGSSARKLRRGAANLLAGRAFERRLFPLTAREIGEPFDLRQALEWGTLPRVPSLSGDARRDFLKAYAHTYLQEEITAEQIVRKLDPFRRFLRVAAQMSGQIINYSKIAGEIGSNAPSVKTYFQILEDTYLGTTLEAFDRSIRKRQTLSPKFYLFDTGVARALTNTLTVELRPHTYAFGTAFEHFVLHEIWRLASYLGKDYQFSYLRTHGGVEIDLVIERPGGKLALVEVKSTDSVTEDDVRPLAQVAADVPDAEAFCLSLDRVPRKIRNVLCLPWDEGIKALGL